MIIKQDCELFNKFKICFFEKQNIKKYTNLWLIKSRGRKANIQNEINESKQLDKPWKLSKSY